MQANFGGGKGEYDGIHNAAQGTPWVPLNILSGSQSGHPNNVPGLSDPEYDALIEQLRVAATAEEYQRLGREADFWLVKNHIVMWGGLNPWFNVTQPWLQGFDGVYARLWIDQALKREMGG